MSGEREFDLIVFGATGYTGQLVADYLRARTQAGLELKWAIAGRNPEKLAAVAANLNLAGDVARIAADSSDPAVMDALAARTRAVLTTVGPYQLYGGPLVAACARAGTDYVDLCGEVNFMRAMIDAHDATAKETGARIVFSCGFDSIPFDLGVFVLEQESLERFGEPAVRVKGRVRKMSLGASGGTLASGRATTEAVMKDSSVLTLLLDHYALAPGFDGPVQPPGDKPETDPDVDGQWVAPFIMAQINTRNIHRSNLLLEHSYGPDFQYDEMMITGAGDEGKARAEGVVQMNANFVSGDGPKPGEGPTKAEREAGFYDFIVYWQNEIRP